MTTKPAERLPCVYLTSGSVCEILCHITMSSSYRHMKHKHDIWFQTSAYWVWNAMVCVSSSCTGNCGTQRWRTQPQGNVSFSVYFEQMSLRRPSVFCPCVCAGLRSVRRVLGWRGFSVQGRRFRWLSVTFVSLSRALTFPATVACMRWCAASPDLSSPGSPPLDSHKPRPPWM